MSDDDKVVYCEFCEMGDEPAEMFYREKECTVNSVPNCCRYCIDGDIEFQDYQSNHNAK